MLPESCGAAFHHTMENCSDTSKVEFPEACRRRIEQAVIPVFAVAQPLQQIRPVELFCVHVDPRTLRRRANTQRHNGKSYRQNRAEVDTQRGPGAFSTRMYNWRLAP